MNAASHVCTVVTNHVNETGLALGIIIGFGGCVIILFVLAIAGVGREQSESSNISDLDLTRNE